MTLTKIKVAAAVAGAVIITGAGAMPLVSHASSFFTVPVAQHTITTLVQTNTSPAATAPSSNAFKADVSDKIKVELLGVTSYPAGEDTWFAPNGDAIECPRPAVVNRENQMHLRPEPQQAMLIKLEKPADTFVRMEIENSTTVSNARIDDDNEQLLLAAFNLNGSPQEFSFRIGFSDMPWKTVANAGTFGQSSPMTVSVSTPRAASAPANACTCPRSAPYVVSAPVAGSIRATAPSSSSLSEEKRNS